MADVTVRWERGWQTAVQGLATPQMFEAAAIVASGQKRRIPVSPDGSHGRPSGYARSRIQVQPGIDALGPHWDVGSDATTPDGTPYPLILELGSKPHTITSKGDYPLRNKRGVVFGRTVRHPGTRPYPWCRAALADLAGRTL